MVKQGGPGTFAHVSDVIEVERPVIERGRTWSQNSKKSEGIPSKIPHIILT